MEQGGVAADQIEIVSLRLQLLPASDTLWAYCSLRGVVPIECWSWTNFREPKEMFWCDLRIYALTVANGRAADAMIDTRSEQPRPRSWANKEYYSKLAENLKLSAEETRHQKPQKRHALQVHRIPKRCRICPNSKESLHLPHLSQFEGISTSAQVHGFYRSLL